MQRVYYGTHNIEVFHGHLQREVGNCVGHHLITTGHSARRLSSSAGKRNSIQVNAARESARLGLSATVSRSPEDSEHNGLASRTNGPTLILRAVVIGAGHSRIALLQGFCYQRQAATHKILWHHHYWPLSENVKLQRGQEKQHTSTRGRAHNRYNFCMVCLRLSGLPLIGSAN